METNRASDLSERRSLKSKLQAAGVTGNLRQGTGRASALGGVGRSPGVHVWIHHESVAQGRAAQVQTETL